MHLTFVHVTPDLPVISEQNSSFSNLNWPIKSNPYTFFRTVVWRSEVVNCTLKTIMAQKIHSHYVFRSVMTSKNTPTLSFIHSSFGLPQYALSIIKDW